MRYVPFGILLLVLLAGCSVDPATRIPGVWSNGELGRVIDVTPNGFCAEVWLDSEAQASAWQIDENDDLLLLPLCSSLPVEPRALVFTFVDDGLTFPGKDGRYTRYIKEPPQPAPDPRLVGLWTHETGTRKFEFIEFTPWGTAMWNRWEGAAGEQTLLAGWASLYKGPEPGLLFSGVEGPKQLTWFKPLLFDVAGNRLTLEFPPEIGKKSYIKATREDLLKAGRAPTR